MITVIRQKFKPEIKMLLNKYFQIVLAEVEEQKKVEEAERKYGL